MRAVGWRTYGAQSQISRKVEAACRSVGLAAPRFATASARQVWELLRDPRLTPFRVTNDVTPSPLPVPTRSQLSSVADTGATESALLGRSVDLTSRD